MKKYIKRAFALVLTIVLALALLPNGFGMDKVEAASDDTYDVNNLISYDLGEKHQKTGQALNSGYILVPEKDGKYPVCFVVHGSSGPPSGYYRNMAYILNNAIKKGYIEPMVIVFPTIYQIDEPEWGITDFGLYISDNRCSRLVNAIKNGTLGNYVTNGKWSTSVAGRIDGNAPMSITGYSMGGSVSLHAGCKMSGTFINIGSCSPSWCFRGSYVTDPKEMIYSNNSKGHFWVSYGLGEPSAFASNVSDIKKAFKQTETYKKFIFLDNEDNPAFSTAYGDHGMKLFYPEMFSFLYYVKNEDIPSYEIIKKACDNLSIPSTGLDGIYGVVSISGSNKVGETLTASVSNSNATEYSYQWRRGKDNISGATSSSYKLTSADVGKKISCKVTDKSGSLTGFVSGYVYGGEGSGSTPQPEFTVKKKTGDLTVSYKDKYDLEVTATGQNLSYEWQYRAMGETSWGKSDYTANSPKITITSATRDVEYQCVVKSGNETKTSGIFKVYVKPIVSAIKSNLTDNKVEEGKDFSITVTAEGLELHYQWMKSTDNKNWTAISGATGATLKAVGAKGGTTEYYKCNVTSCSQTVSKQIAITSVAHTHSWDNGKVTKAATCTADGVKTYTCTKCNGTKTEAIKATGHKEVEIPAVAATCEKDGSTAGKKCSVCGTVTVAPKTVTKLGHSWDNGKVTKEATATENGEMTYACTRCKVTKTASIPAIGKKDGPEAPEGIATQDCSAEGVYDGKILKVTSDMEYSRYENFVDAVTCTDGEVVNLAPGTYYVRYKETEAVKAGKSVAVTIAVHETQTTEDKTTEEQTTTEEQKTTEQATTVEQKTTTATVEQQTENKPAKTANTETASAEAKSDGYQNTESITKDKLKKNLLVVDKKSGGKFKVTKVTKKKGKVVGGTVSYMAPYNKNCTKATAPDYVKIAGVKFKVTEINKNAFKNCKKIKSFTVGKNVTKIGSSAFSGCSKLKSVTIKSKKLTKIGAKAFSGISKNAKFKVPKSKLFNMAKMIKSAKAPKNVKVTY